MTSRDPIHDNRPPDAASPARSIASVLLFIHLFCILVALSANHASSPLQRRLLGIFRPYTTLLNFDHGHVRYDLTQGTADDAESRLEFLAATPTDPTRSEERWQQLQAGMRGSDRAERYRRLATLLNSAADRDDTNVAAIIGQALGAHLLAHHSLQLSEFRGRRHLLQTPEDLSDPGNSRYQPDDPAHFAEVYRGQAIVDRDRGEVLIQRVEERGQVAPPWSPASAAEGAK